MQPKAFQMVLAVRIYKKMENISHGIQQPNCSFVTNASSVQEIEENITLAEDETLDVSIVDYIPNRI